jgi:hypothetical protein
LAQTARVDDVRKYHWLSNDRILSLDRPLKRLRLPLRNEADELDEAATPSPLTAHDVHQALAMRGSPVVDSMHVRRDPERAEPVHVRRLALMVER